MVKSETIAVDATGAFIPELGPTEVGFVVMYNDEPVEGATVSLISKTLSPQIFQAVTDANGFAKFDTRELYPPEIHFPCEFFKEEKWLLAVHVEGSDLAYFADDWSGECQMAYYIKLEKYTTVPTFYVEFETRDILGADLFAKIASEIEAWALKQEGFTDVRVEKVSDTVFRVYFKPPWSKESPLVIFFGATWSFVIALVLFVVALGLIYLIGWKFGRKTVVAIAGIGILLLLFLILLAIKPKERSLPPRGTGLITGRAGERRGGRPRTEEERLRRHYG